MSVSAADESSRPKRLRRAWKWVRWLLFGLVLFFVGRHAYRLFHDVGPSEINWHWGWLAAAMFVSIVGWVPSAWYWRWLMNALGAPTPWPEAACAYYCGHLGKYVPGKAMALVIRAAMLRSNGVPPAVAAFAATIETLAYIAAGAATAAFLLPRLLSGSSRFEPLADMLKQPHWQVVLPVVVIVASLGGLVVLSYASIRMALRLKETLPALGALDRPLSAGASLTGFTSFLAAWWLQGLTLGLTLRALGGPVDWSDWPLWTGTAAVAMVGGFLAVFAPGGLGVREGLLIELLRGQFGPQQAVLAAVLYRGVTLAGELLASGALWMLVRFRTRKQPLEPHPHNSLT